MSSDVNNDLFKLMDYLWPLLHQSAGRGSADWFKCLRAVNRSAVIHQFHHKQKQEAVCFIVKGQLIWPFWCLRGNETDFSSGFSLILWISLSPVGPQTNQSLPGTGPTGPKPKTFSAQQLHGSWTGQVWLWLHVSCSEWSSIWRQTVETRSQTEPDTHDNIQHEFGHLQFRHINKLHSKHHQPEQDRLM